MRPLNIIGWARDHHGCGNYRVGLPMWALNRVGHNAVAYSRLDPKLPDGLDVLIGQIVVTDEASEFWISQAKRTDRAFAMVYEIDDDLWHLDPSNPSAGYWSREMVAKLRNNIEVADAVIVTNDHLAEVISPINDNVAVIPNCVDAAVLDYERPRAEKLTLGWAGGSSHGIDFASVRNNVRTFLRRHPEVDTHFMGVNHGPDVGRPNARFTGWQSNLVEYLQSIDFDLGIAPLAYTTFNRSKSDLRFLEYAALGIPVVVSDFGPYADSVVHAVTGLKVKHPHEWATHLGALANDEAMRAELGRNARNWASTRTIQANVWRYEEAFASLLGIPYGLAEVG